MKKFFVALFSVVSLLAVIVPSSASAIKHLERETNAQRFARGLPPNPPTRRSTALARRQSPTPSKQYIVVYDSHGQKLGFVQNGDSPNSVSVGDALDFPVTFDPTSHTVFSTGSGNHYLGGHNHPAVTMGSKLSTSTLLQKVPANNNNDEANIWFSGANNELLGKWTNPDGTLVPMYFFENNDGSILMTGDPTAPPGSEQAHLFLASI